MVIAGESWSVWERGQVQVRDEAGEIVLAALPEREDREKVIARARMMAKAPEMAAALAAFVSFTSYVVRKRGSCVTSQHLALDDEDVANAEEMLKDARRLLDEAANGV